jgi:hypothetical protein
MENRHRAAALLRFMVDELEDYARKLFDFPDATADDVRLCVQYGCDPSELPRW